MFRRHSIACALLGYAALASAVQAEIIKDRDNDLALGAGYINVLVDEFHNGGAPTTWFARDGAKSAYAPDQVHLSLHLPFGETTGRSSFWVPRSQPTFFLEGYNPPSPEPSLGDRGLTFHTIDVEALAGASVVTVDPSNVPGRFTYSYAGGSRTVDLPVLARTPEPSAATLALLAIAPLLRRRRR